MDGHATPSRPSGRPRLTNAIAASGGTRRVDLCRVDITRAEQPALFGFHPCGDELLRRKIRDLPRELDFVGARHRAGVDDADVHALEIERLNEGHLVAVDLAVG